MADAALPLKSSKERWWGRRAEFNTMDATPVMWPTASSGGKLLDFLHQHSQKTLYAMWLESLTMSG
jgi:hypothetical protein